jgi:tRNA-dihydrouridine synthase
VVEDNNGFPLKHAVPCALCQASNGSCVAPPVIAPVNLRGCMLGRAAMDHPAQFWDVDRYWYGEAANPVNNRRQVIDQYCQVLEGLYPRRCCDDEPAVTSRRPAPRVVHTRPYCHVCRELFPENDIARHSKDSEQESTNGSAPLKITSRVMDRSLKPVLGLFFQQPGARAFRRVCEELSRDGTVRNCGPAFVLRKAVNKTISDQVLDQLFVRTDELWGSDIVEHVAPAVDAVDK